MTVPALLLKIPGRAVPLLAAAALYAGTVTAGTLSVWTDDFESGPAGQPPAGWTVDTAGGTVTVDTPSIPAAAGSLSATIAKLDTSAARPALSRTWPAGPADRILVSWDGVIPGPGGTVGIRLADTRDSTGIHLAFDGLARIMSREAGSFMETGLYFTADPARYIIEAIPADTVFRLYIDDPSFPLRTLPLARPVADLVSVSFYAGTGGAAWSVDNIAVHRCDDTPPEPAGTLEAVPQPDGRIALRWAYTGSSPDVDRLMVIRRSDGFARTADDTAGGGFRIYAPADSVDTLSDLAQDTVHYFALFARDSSGNWSDTIPAARDTAVPHIRQITGLTVLPDTAAMTTDDSLHLQVQVHRDDGSVRPVAGDSLLTWQTTAGGTVVTGPYLVPDTTGVCTVTASYAGFADTAYVTVFHGVPVQVVLAPDSARITADDTLRFRLTALDGAGISWEAAPLAQWSDTDPSANVMDGIYLPRRTGTWTVGARYRDLADSTVVTVVPGMPVRIALTPAGTTAAAGDTVTYTAAAFDADDNSQTVSDSITLYLHPDSAAAVSGSRVTATRPGIYTVTAARGALTCSTFLTVIPDTPAAVRITAPPDARTVVAGGTLACTLEVTDRFGNLADTPVPVTWTWTAENGDSGASFFPSSTVTAGGRSAAVFHPPVTAGSRVRPIVTAGSLSDTGRVVSVVSGDLDHLRLFLADSVTPAGDTAVSADHDSLTLVAVGFDSTGNRLGLQDATWISGDTAVIRPDSSFGPWTALTARQAGSTKVTAFVTMPDTLRAVSGSITVHPGTLAQVRAVPAGTTLTADDTCRFLARGYDHDGNTVPVPDTLSWSAAGSLGTIDIHTGRFEAARAGTGYVVLRTVSGIPPDTARPVIVVPGTTVAVVCDPGSVTVAGGDTLTLAAYALDGDGNRTNLCPDSGLVWLPGAGLAFLACGVFRADSLGHIPVIMTLDSLADTVRVTVTATPPFSFRVGLGPTGNDTAMTVTAGTAVPVTVSFHDARNLPLTGLGRTVRVVMEHAGAAAGSLWALTGQADPPLHPADPVIFYAVPDSGILRYTFRETRAQPGTPVTITVEDSALSGNTARLQVVHGPVPGALTAVPDQRSAPAGASIPLTLTVVDSFGNRMYGYTENPAPFTILTVKDSTVTAPVLNGDVSFGSPAVPALPGEPAGSIPARTVFDQGTLRLTVQYSAPGESLYFRFTDDSTGAAGTSPGLVWYTAETVENVRMYPVPFTDRLYIRCYLHLPSRVRITITDAVGEPVRGYDLLAPAGLFDLAWPGTNGTGRQVAARSYRIIMRVSSSAGEKTFTRTVVRHHGTDAH